MDKSTLENVQLEDILHFLEREGIDSLATAEDQLCYVWCLFQHSEESLRTASRDLEELRVKHMEEMKEVENYVNHARQLTEEREALTHDFEKEIEQLQLEFKEQQLQREIELKEIEGMLDQEGLSEIAQSSASEQIAYLLGERTTLLEKLELADPKLNSYNSVGYGIQEVHLKDEFEQIQTLENELQKQQESLQQSKETLNKPPNEELEKEKTIQGNLKRNMEEEAATRLHQMNEKICRLTKKLDTKEKEHNKLELALESTQLEIESLKENLSRLKENDSTDLQEANQHSDGLDRETLALRNHVQEDSSRKMHVELDKKKEIVAKDNCEADRNEKSDETFHERSFHFCYGCKKMIEDQKCKHTDLLHKFQKLEQDHEHLLEWNEEFDLLLGETQNQTKEERKQFEYHVEKLQRKVVIMNQEEFEVLESKLSEEKAWRKQLSSDLKKAQKVLQAESQSSLEKSLRYQQQDEELQKLRQNWQRVQTLCTSIEKELQLERTKNFDLKQQNNSLQEENIKIKSELKQAQKKLLDSTNMCSSITADWEGSQQKVRELEQEILKQSENIQSQNNLHEKLAQEKTRVAYAEKKVLELQEKLEAANESCAKTCILDKKQLEEAVKEARKNEAKLKVQYQEEQQKRKLLDQNVDELQEHIQYLHAKEALMEQSNCKQQLKIEQQEVQLQILEDVKKRSDEQIKNNKELLEKVSLLQQEKTSLEKEYSQFLKQLDVLMRNYNEKHRHHKAKLRKAKEYLRNEVKQRDGRIKQLENELEKMQKLIEKEKASQDQIIMQNDNLLLEKKQLLEKLTEQDETIQGNIYMISSVQNRVLFLGEENKLLQENSDRLTQQISQLERILRSIQVRRGEEPTISELSENELLNKKLIFPNLSFSTTGLAKSTENLKVTEIHKSEELLGSPKSSPSSSLSQPFEVGILNVASLGGKPSSHDQDKNQKDGATDN